MWNTAESSSRTSKIPIDESPAPHESGFNGEPLEMVLVPTPVNSPFSDDYPPVSQAYPSTKA